jgi:amino acid transporter
MILILGILLLGTVAAAIGKSPKWQFIFSAAIIAYALVAFLVAVTLVAHGGKP